MSKAVDRITEALSELTEGDLRLLGVSRQFDQLTPKTYIDKWIEHAQRDLVLEAFSRGRTLVFRPKVEREGYEVRVHALTSPLFDAE